MQQTEQTQPQRILALTPSTVTIKPDGRTIQLPIIVRDGCEILYGAAAYMASFIGCIIDEAPDKIGKFSDKNVEFKTEGRQLSHYTTVR